MSGDGGTVSGGGGTVSGDGGDGGTGPRARKPWWASDAPGAAASDRDGGEASAERFSSPECQVCPVCTLLRLAGELRPDAMVHLADAVRHLTLAAKAVIDAEAGGVADDRFERIDLDE